MSRFKRNNKRSTVPASGGEPRTAGNLEEIDRRRIAARAYELYQARGAEPGREMDDWLEAEHELTVNRDDS